ncbi:MAG: hypothetical protein MI741_01945 [Rhodospirillales bacterium]|nr:hypothetical protein [Rhodospirillales bacterium]
MSALVLGSVDGSDPVRQVRPVSKHATSGGRVFGNDFVNNIIDDLSLAAENPYV